jgi:acetyltransferase-like isoleucine patch superfamily enzyme
VSAAPDAVSGAAEGGTGTGPRGVHAGAHVSAGAQLADSVAVGPGAVIHDGTRIGPDSHIGAGVVIHLGTVLGARCVVEDGAVLGKRPRLRAGSRAGGEAGAGAGAPPDPLVIEEDATVCCGAVLYAGAHIGPGAIVGDQTQVRERARIGAGTIIGRGSAIEFDAHVGARVSIQSGVYVTAGTVVEDDVFLGPGVLTTNDNSMGRHARADPLRGPIFRRACRVGAGALLLPGVVVGEEAFVAARTLVTRDVRPREVVMGTPARVVGHVSDEDLIERWR